MNIKEYTSDMNWRSNDNTVKKEFDFQSQDDSKFPCLIPSSPNWYYNNILSCLDGYCVFGGRCNIIVVNLKIKPPLVEYQLSVCSDYNGRTTSVALISCRTDSGDIMYVAVSCDNGLVRLFILHDKKLFKEQQKHKGVVNAISWSPINPNLLASADERGSISWWNFIDDHVSVWLPMKLPVMTLKLSLNLENIIAIGYKDGHIILGNIYKKEILVQHKVHHNEITSLSWSPFSTEGYLASTSKDQDVKIWHFDNKKPYKVYQHQQKNNSRNTNSFKKLVFTAVLWLNDTEVLIGQQNGDIVCWNINDNKKSIQCGHKRNVFSICRDDLTNQFVSVAMDRTLIIWDADRLQTKAEIPSFGGFIYSLSNSPIDANCVAIGVGDTTMKVWSFGDLEKSYSCSTFSQKTNNVKFLVVSFHPTKEGICAYGLSNGEVGFYSVVSRRYDKSSSNHKKSVYSLCWGPSIISNETADTSCIDSVYSVGQEGIVLVHQMGKFNSQAVHFTEILKKKNNLKSSPLRSEIAWRHDYKYVAIGNEDGVIDVFSGNQFNYLLKITVHRKSINCLAWHHDIEDLDDGIDYSCWLASCSDENNIFVTDVSIVTSLDINNLPELVTSPYRKLTGHSSRVYRVVWNPHKNGILASCSQDNTVQIWNVQDSEPIGNFREHDGRVQAVVWSLNDPDILYSGGEDCTVRRWRISKLTHQLPPKGSNNRGAKKKKKKEETSLNELETATVSTALACSNEYKTIDVPINCATAVHNKDDDKIKKKKKQKSLLPKSSVGDSKKKELMQEDCILLAKYLKAENSEAGSGSVVCGFQPGADGHANLGLYGTRVDAFKLLENECDGHKVNNHKDHLTQLNVWSSNIGGMLEDAVENKSMNDTLVALSPLGGYEMWKASMLAYAQQLEENTNFHQAALYYVALGNPLKAINIFKVNELYKEALLLAKVQLSKDDPLIKELYLLWCDKLLADMNYERAAECFLSAGCTDEAVSTLAKRGDSSSLATALKVAVIYGREDLKNKYIHRALETLVFERKWIVCKELLESHNEIEIYHLKCTVGEILEICMNNTNLSLPADVRQIDESTLNDYTNTNAYSKMLHLLTLLEKKYSINVATMHKMDSMSNKLLHEQVTVSRNATTNEVFSYVNDQILLGVFYLLRNKCEKSFKHWLNSFQILLSMGYIESAKSLYSFLLPNSYDSFRHLAITYSDETCSKAALMSCYTNFNAFHALVLVYEHWWALGRSFKPSCDMNPDSLTDEKRCASTSQSATNITNQTCYCDKQSIYRLASYACSLFLSDTHAQYELLLNQLNSVETLICELKLKSRLHTQAKNKSEKISKQLDELDMKRRCLADKRDNSPCYLKEYCYPKVEICVLPLLYVCSYYHGDNDVSELLKSIKKWLEERDLVFDDHHIYLEKLLLIK